MSSKSNNYASFFVALTSGILYGCSMTIVSGTNLEVPWDKYQGEAPIITGLISSAYLLGAAFGSFFGGFVSDRVGPKKVLAISCVMSLSASICIAIQISQLALLIVFRVITGLGIGVVCSIGPLYISEQADPKRKGMLGSLFQLFVCVGQLLAYALNIAFQRDNNEAWRFEFLLAGGVFSIVFLCGYPCLPESAGYLSAQQAAATSISNPRVNINTHTADVEQGGGGGEGEGDGGGGGEQASSSSSSPGVSSSTLSGQQQQQQPQQAKKSKGSIWDDLSAMGAAALSSKKAFTIGIVLAILQQITGINAIIFFSPSIFATFGSWFTEKDHQLIGSLIVGGWNLISVVVAFGLVDRVGRKPLLICGWVLMTIGNVLMCIVGFVPKLEDYILQFGLPGLVLFLFGFQIGPGPIFFVVVSELYDVDVRGRAMGLIVMFNWLANIMVTLTFPQLQIVMLKKVFIIFSITSVLAVLFVVFFVYETKTKTPSSSSTTTAPAGAEEEEGRQQLRDVGEESEYLSGNKNQPNYSEE